MSYSYCWQGTPDAHSAAIFCCSMCGATTTMVLIARSIHISRACARNWETWERKFCPFGASAIALSHSLIRESIETRSRCIMLHCWPLTAGQTYQKPKRHILFSFYTGDGTSCERKTSPSMLQIYNQER